MTNDKKHSGVYSADLQSQMLTLEHFSDDYKKELLPDDEMLIAWLDGDLSEQEKILFEQKMADSPELQRKKEELCETWELLDTLKTDPAGPQLTGSTMEMVALCADRECAAREQRIRKKRCFYVIGIIAIIIAVFLVAHFTALSLYNHFGTKLQEKTPFISRLDQLETIGSFDILTALNSSDLFKRAISPEKKPELKNFNRNTERPAPPFDRFDRTDSNVQNTQSVKIPLNKPNTVGDKSNISIEKPNAADDKSNAVKNEEKSDKFFPNKKNQQNDKPRNEFTEITDPEELWGNAKFQRLVLKYHRLSKTRQKELFDLYRKIEDSPQKAKLFQTLENYYNWLTLLHETQRDTILFAPQEERLAKINICLKQTIEIRQTKRYEPTEPPMFRHFSKIYENGPDRFFMPNEQPREMNNRMPARKQERNNNIPAMKKNGFHQQIDKNTPSFVNRNPNVWNKLPEELRNEDLSAFYDQFKKFVEKHSKKDAQKPDKEQGRNRDVFRGTGLQLIQKFVDEQPTDLFMNKLSPKAKEYIATLPEAEKKKTLGLLFAFNLYCSRIQKKPYRQQKEFSDETSPFSPRPLFVGQQQNPIIPPFNDKKIDGAFWLNETTGELAETLRKLPQNKQDELLSLPSDEMYAQLLILHWGFNPKKLGTPKPQVPK